MLRCRKFLISIICLSIFASTMSAYAEEEIEDLIDIAESKDKIIAIIEGRKTITFDLRPNEKVLWSGSKGHLGAFLKQKAENLFLVKKNIDVITLDPLKSRGVQPEQMKFKIDPNGLLQHI